MTDLVSSPPRSAILRFLQARTGTSQPHDPAWTLPVPLFPLFPPQTTPSPPPGLSHPPTPTLLLPLNSHSFICFMPSAPGIQTQLKNRSQRVDPKHGILR